MNWDAIGAIGEVLGALGVIATLIYLTTQIRQNTNAMRASSLDSETQISNDVRLGILSDPELTKIYYEGLKNVASLDDIERERFRLILTNALWAVRNSYVQSQIGKRASWEAHQNIILRVISSPGGSWFWSNCQSEFDPDFRDEINRLIEKGNV
jgi:hypothetical protein